MNENTRNTNLFYLDFNVTGEERKRLVNAISEYTGADANYLGAPTFAYKVDYFTISKDGCVSFADRSNIEEIEGLIETLSQKGFVSQVSNLGCEDDAPQEATEASTAEDISRGGNSLHEGAEANTEPLSAENARQAGLTVSLPRNGLTDASIENLRKLVMSKANLIWKALGVNCLKIDVEDDKISFPWWDTLPEPEATSAYTAFLAALCKMARESKRVTATEKKVESEKYAFRGFLLRLGFIGADCKEQRKLLLKNLSGSAAFPNKAKADAFSAAQKAKRDAAKAVSTEITESPAEESTGETAGDAGEEVEA